MPAGYLVYLDILKAVARPNLTLGELDDLVKRDAALSHHVLRLANSAAFAQRREVESIRQALMLVGRDTVRRWAALAVVAGLSTTQPTELLVMATVRARFCELLASRTAGADAAGGAFLAGLCSMLDAILERPMPDVLDELSLGSEIRMALLGRDNLYRRLLDCVLAYDHGDWTGTLASADIAGVPPRLLTPAYIDALRFAYEVKL
jgi:c-di-GMP phosphodiesterase